MFRASHPLLRWLRLAMACLALAAGATPAHAQPGPEAPVAALVVQVAPARPHAREERGVHVAPIKVVAPSEAGRPPESAGRLAPSGPQGPSRRLFLLHRALLR